MKLDSVRLTVLVEDSVGYNVRGLLGEHGLSILIEGVRGGKVYRVLFDTGQSGDTLLHNLKLLGLNLNRLDVIVLSHRHYDHTGGLLKVLDVVKAPIIAHPHILNPQMYISNDFVRLDLGLPYSTSEIEGKGGKLLLVKSPLEVAPGMYFLGEIPRVTGFEGEMKGFYTIRDGEVVSDQMLDDSAVAVNVNGKLIVVTGCSHSGVVNICKHALKVVEGEPLAVIGGFHLVNAGKEVVEKTIEGLKDLGFNMVLTGHCTGFKAEVLFSLAFREGFRRISSGCIFEFK